MIRLVEHVAIAYGPKGIRCNAIAPGLTDTPILDPFAESMGGRAALFERQIRAIPARRAAQPEEIAEAAAYLASDAAAYVNGVTLPVDGGMVA